MMSKNVQPQTGTQPFREKKGRKDQVDQILAANFLDFSPISNISVVDKRSQIRHEFRQQSYTVGANTQTMEIRLGGGDSFIYGPNSYLSFRLSVSAGSAGFGASSVLNLFRTAEIKSQNGNEIDRVEEVNLYALQNIKYSTDQSHLERGHSELMGFSINTWNNFIDSTGAGGRPTEFDFIVPLRYILPIFGYPGLLPSSGLIAGSVIRITLEPFITALVSANSDANTTYTLSNVRLVTDELILTDAFAKRLQLLSARSGPGLSLTWESWYHQRETSNSTRVEVMMANSVSRACRSWAVVRNSANQDLTQDSISALSAADSIEEYQFKLGNLRFPDQVCDNQSEHFVNALIAFQQYDKDTGSAVDRLSYTTNPADADEGPRFLAGNRIVAASFERNHVLSLSGVSVNGNRLLRVNLLKDAAGDLVDLFMSYTKHASIHLDTNLIST
jgi:hypothetical protein